MPVKRRAPKERVTPITPKAIELFRRMQRLERGCDAWYDLHNLLHLEIQARVWQWPLDATPLWDELIEAARLARQQARQMKVEAPRTSS